VLSRLYEKLTKDSEQAEFIALQRGAGHHDEQEARRVATDPTSVTIDKALGLAASGRWVDDLVLSENIARAQLDRAMSQDLTSSQRDWPERVARAAFELTQALVWQGRFDEADELCRTYYHRVAGAKWAAWELAMRATVRFAHGQYERAEQHLDRGIAILEAEGFADFIVTLWTSRSACRRMLRDPACAARYLHHAEKWPRKGPGSTAAVLVERAEHSHQVGDAAAATATWTILTNSSLPLWAAIGHLRLAETGVHSTHHCSAALKRFEAIHCRWGGIRAAALRDGLSRAEVAKLSKGLGPPEPFMPSAPWLL
jgi:hypothetical protein